MKKDTKKNVKANAKKIFTKENAKKMIAPAIVMAAGIVVGVCISGS